jgi:enterochelin esterase-like enzyme
MGGQGAFTIGLTHPELFSSIASHMGALNLPPLAGTAEEQAANAPLEPLTLVDSLSVRQLRRHTYYFDGGSSDDFGFGQAALQMGTELTTKGVAYDYQGGPGRHEDAYWVPKLDRSFALHSRQFRAHPVPRPHEPGRPTSAYTWP